MSDDWIDAVHIEVRTKDGGMIGYDHYADVTNAKELRDAIAAGTAQIELDLIRRKLIPDATQDAAKLEAIRRLSDTTHEFDGHGRLFVFAEDIYKVLDQ